MTTTVFYRKILLWLLLITCTGSLAGQSYPANLKHKLQCPLPRPLLLAGNFGEPRSGHFHTGVDIKTSGHTGLPVLAVSDGKVIQIDVSPGGYGKSLYIKHTDGFISLYGHLQSFRDDIAQLVIKRQYAAERFAIHISSDTLDFTVHAGDTIAWSGNTGNSEGPHLHFEVREPQSGNPVNPLTAGLQVRDHIAPVLNRIYIYRQTQKFRNWKPIIVEMSRIRGQYRVRSKGPVPVAGLSAIGLEAYDLLDGSANHCGIYRIKLYFDKEKILDYQIDEIAFRDNRFVNSFMDYEKFYGEGKPVIHLFIEPDNLLDLYTYHRNRGYFQVDDQVTHLVRIEVWDAAGNRSTVQFKVQLDPEAFQADTIFTSVEPEFIPYAEPTIVQHKNLRINFPEGALFDNLYFFYQRLDSVNGLWGAVHRIDKDRVGLGHNVKISVFAPQIPLSLKPKALIVNLSPSGEIISNGGYWQNNWLVTSIGHFGDYAIAIDTVPPVIYPVNFNAFTSFKRLYNLRLHVSDNLSGIAKIRGEIDRHWALFDFDPKNQLIEYHFGIQQLEPDRMHHLKVTVTDRRDNQTTYETDFYK